MQILDSSLQGLLQHCFLNVCCIIFFLLPFLLEKKNGNQHGYMLPCCLLQNQRSPWRQPAGGGKQVLLEPQNGTWVTPRRRWPPIRRRQSPPGSQNHPSPSLSPPPMIPCRLRDASNGAGGSSGRLGGSRRPASTVRRVPHAPGGFGLWWQCPRRARHARGPAGP